MKRVTQGGQRVSRLTITGLPVRPLKELTRLSVEGQDYRGGRGKSSDSSPAQWTCRKVHHYSDWRFS